MSLRVAVLTISDSASNDKRADVSGPALREVCVSLGWDIIATATVPDEVGAIANAITQWADSGVADVILTTGGTGVAPRDVTPEATRTVLDREIPGIGEFLRAKGLEQTKFAMLSRSLAGSRKKAFVLNLPGAPAGATFSLQSIQHLVPHIVKLLHGDTEH